MVRRHRPPLLALGMTAALALALAACAGDYPNSTFNHTTEFNTAIDELWDKLLFWGTIIFVVVEALLLYVIFRFRHREGHPEPKHVHGNTTLEIMWTAIPAVILALIAVPTVRTIFVTQAKAVPNALQVEVVGHQWWWEFRYPQYTTRTATGKVDTLTTANELYLPVGRTANFALRTADVIHSFWVPQLGGKRDVVANHVNYLWFTPKDSLAGMAFNGSCNEYCGASHANMKFRTFTVSPAEFEQWARWQLQPAAFAAASPAPPAPPGAPAAPASAASGGEVAPVAQQPQPPQQSPAAAPPTGGQHQGGQATGTAPGEERGAQDRIEDATSERPLSRATQGPTAGVTPSQAVAYVFPRERLQKYNIPNTPPPEGLSFPANLKGDAARGQQIYSRSACIGCHAIRGNPMSVGITGPNLTHIGSRYTIAGAQYPNTPQYMALWIKNSRAMKPGSIMPTLGKGQQDPITGQAVTVGGLDDQQIADIVAYLQALQ